MNNIDKSMIDESMRGEILVSNPVGICYENEKEILQQFNNFKEKFLKPQYKDVRYLKIIDYRGCDEYHYKTLNITIDLLTGEVWSNTEDSLYSMCSLKEEIKDDEDFQFKTDFLEKNRNGDFYIHKKLVQDGIYTFLDENKQVIEKNEDEYVLNGLDIDDCGYGDYIVMSFKERENKFYIKDFNGDIILLNLCKENYKDLISKLEVIYAHFQSRHTDAEARNFLYRSFNFY
jgi:hypothetical protein